MDGGSHSVIFLERVMKIQMRRVDSRSDKPECTLLVDAGEYEIEISDDFTGIGIRTPEGLFGIAQRDGGIEVMLEGKSVWTSFGALQEQAKQKAEDEAFQPTRREVEEVLRLIEWKQNKDFPTTWYHPTSSRTWLMFADDCELDEPIRPHKNSSVDRAYVRALMDKHARNK
jgi:hypothetical protein